MATGHRGARAAAWIVAASAASGLALQLYLLLVNAAGFNLTPLGAVARFLSFFTIFTNIAVLASAMAYALSPRGLLAHPRMLSGVTAAIILVGIVYHVALARLWSPAGAQWWADALLHSVTPVAATLFWLVCVPKASLRWTDPLLWALYPLAYLVYALINGALTGFYAYPFIDVSQISSAALARNVLVLVAVFVVLGLFRVALGSALGRFDGAAQSS